MILSDGESGVEMCRNVDGIQQTQSAHIAGFAVALQLDGVGDAELVKGLLARVHTVDRPAPGRHDLRQARM